MAGQSEATTAEGPWDDPPQPHRVLLGALRWAWDGAYLIAEDDHGRLVITRGDGYGPSIRAGDLLEARDVILADFARRPVMHPLDPGALGRRIAFERAHPDVTWGIPTMYHKVTGNGPDGTPLEEVALTVDGMLRCLIKRGFDWPEAGSVPPDPRERARAAP